MNLAQDILARKPVGPPSVVWRFVRSSAIKAGGERVDWINRNGTSYVFSDGSTIAVDKHFNMAAH